MSTQATKVSKGTIIKWLVTIGVPLCLFLIPETETYSYNVKMFLVVTVLGILMVAFEQVHLMAVSMLFPIGYIVSGLVPMDVAYSAWLQTMPLVVIGGYMIAMVLNRVGLLKRMAYWCFIRVRGSYYGLLYSVFIVGCILNTVTGGNAWVMMAAFTFGLCMGFDLGKSIDSAIIMLVGGLSAGASCMFIYSPYFMNLLWNAANKTLPEGAEQYGATWLEFFWQNIPYLIFCLAFIFVLPKIFKPKKKLPGVEYFKEEYAKLGKMSRDEKIGAAFTIALIVFMMTGNIHGIALDWGFIVLPWLMFFPGIRIATEEDVKGVDWSMVFFCIAMLVHWDCIQLSRYRRIGCKAFGTGIVRYEFQCGIGCYLCIGCRVELPLDPACNFGRVLRTDCTNCGRAWHESGGRDVHYVHGGRPSIASL